MNTIENTKSWNSASTVNEVVLLHPLTLEVFRSFGIDTCCGGARSLQQAADRAGIQLDILETALGKALAQAQSSR